MPRFIHKGVQCIRCALVGRPVRRPAGAIVVLNVVQEEEERNLHGDAPFHPQRSPLHQERGMLSNITAKAVTLLLLFVIVTAGYCAPTASVSDTTISLHARCVSDSADIPVATADITQLNEAYSPHLTDIAHELLKPPGDSIDSPVPLVAATSLPAVPGALFMGLTGFLCVSLVRDRKVWMAALAGLLWAGQAGFAALPQLARHLASKGHTAQYVLPNRICALALRRSDRLRSDIEGTAYIGLLRYLAGIPDTANSVQRRACKVQGIGYSVQRLHFLNAKRYALDASRHTTYNIRHTTKSPQFAWASVCDFSVPATKRLVRITKRHAYFSPAFTFENLARGPPPQNLEEILSFAQL